MQILPATALAVVPPAQTSRPGAAEIAKAASGFEALFLDTLLKGARAGLPGDDLTGGSAVSSAQQMLDTQLSQSAASAAGFGIAEAIARQFSKGGVGE
ncbi:rod-binding protein [Paracoccus sp. T5]|uniref:rod-binding protein n=1 Tax=Paracoccus sp. T5 TaxID=3402161 RepID=UPI003ADC4957